MAKATAHATIRRCGRGFAERDFTGRRISEGKSETKLILEHFRVNVV